MKINIKRFNKNDALASKKVEYTVNKTNLLQSLFEIKTKIDNTLTFRCGCKSGVCGSCAVRVNGVEKLACKTTIEENDVVEAISNTSIIRDLVVDVSHETLLLKNSKTFIEENSTNNITQKDIQLIDVQSNCILCSSCHSSCPVYSVNKDFLGPFALSRALRYVNDKKIHSGSKIIDSIQDNGIWDCTLCSACTLVCPQNIDPKNDIMQLQNISVQYGYENPNMKAFDSNMGFDMSDMGFDPNSF